jgi:hypothetical protein
MNQHQKSEANQAPTTQINSKMTPAQLHNKADIVSSQACTYFIKGGNDRKGTRCWRLVSFIIFLAVFINGFVRDSLYDLDIEYHMCYLTNISLLVLVVYLGVGVIHASKDRQDGDCITKAYRILQILAVSAQMGVTIFYWPAVAPDSLPYYDNWCDALIYCYAHNVLVHGLGNIPTLYGLFTEPTKIRFKDISYVLAYVLVYSCILIPTTLWGKQLYPNITFEDSTSWIMYAAAVILFIVCFTITWLISGCRHQKFFGRKLGSSGSDNNVTSVSPNPDKKRIIQQRGEL